MASTETETDAWPTPDGTTVVTRRDDTLVGGTPPPPPPAPPGDRRIGAGMLLALGVLLLVAAGIVVAWLLTHRDSSNHTTTVIVTTAPKAPAPAVAKVAVPRLIGLKEQAAVTRLTQLGLRPKEVFRPAKQAKGVVVSQKPEEATRLAKGSAVTLVIDKGAPKIAVPKLVGEQVSTARAQLDRLGIVSTLTQVTSTQPAGTVVDQAPAAGSKLAKGSTLTLAVAKSKPATTGSTTASTTAPTTTAATTTAPTTTAAAPPQPTSATMPDVSGQTEQEAVQAMSRAGILASLAFVPGTDPLGTVVSQAKSEGTSLRYHAHVQINLSTGPGDKPKEQVPNVIGKTLSDAVSSVNAASLRLIFVKLPVTQRSQAGKIVQQSPLGGNEAPRNAQVLVFLGAYRG